MSNSPADCDHKFIGSNTCAKCGTTLQQLRAACDHVFNHPDVPNVCTACAWTRPLTVYEWVEERLANTGRIAATKTGADRESWLEDQRYWQEIQQLLDGQTEAAVIASVMSHWFVQGGDASFGPIGGGSHGSGAPSNADELVSAILERVRAKRPDVREAHALADSLTAMRLPADEQLSALIHDAATFLYDVGRS